MRHRHRKAKLGRTTEHRTALLSNLVCSLIKHRRIETTLAKAKAARVVADKMVTLSKKGQSDEVSLQYRRLVAARLQRRPRRFFPKKNGVPGREQRKQWRENEDVVRILFEDIAPGFAERNGGYTRVIKLGRRRGDAAEMAILEWVSDSDQPATEDQPAQAKKKAEPEETAAEETETEKATPQESSEETAKNKSAEEHETEGSEDKPSGETAEEETEEAPAVETEAETPAKDAVEEEGPTEAKTEDSPGESGEAETKPEDKDKKSE
jgi:large subunit ribosomal protein L17